MKKTLLFAALLALAGVFTSCIRDDDWEMLKHPIHVTGSINPYWGVPVAYGQLNMNDILTHFSGNYQGYIDPNNDTITVVYNTNASNTIYAFSAFMKGTKAPTLKGNPGAKAMLYTRDSVFVDTIDIDFFNDVNSLDSINIAHFMVDLKVSAKAIFRSETSANLVAPHVHAVFDSLEIWYDSHDDVHKKFDPADMNLDTVRVMVNDIREGFKLNFTTVDMADVANDMPKRIYARYHFKLNVSDSIISQNIADMPIGQILDSLQATQLSYSGDLHVEMPLNIEVENMHYNFDLDMGEGLNTVNLDSILQNISEGIAVNIDDSKFRLILDNGIPLNLTLSASAYDENGLYLWTAFTNELIPSANLAQDPLDPITWYAVSPSHKELMVELDQNDIEALNKATTLRVSLMVGSNNKHVAVKKDDYLKLKAYIQIHPTVDFDIDVND